MNHHTRLSMPELSDDSSSEPDASILDNRGGQVDAVQRVTYNPNSENVPEEHAAAEDTSIEGEDDNDDDAEDVDQHDTRADDDELVVDEQPEDEQVEIGEPLGNPAALGLKEISNLGRFTVSSHKQGNGVEELRNDDLTRYWQYVFLLLVFPHFTYAP